MSLIMEEGTRQEWGFDRDYYCLPTSFINQSCSFNEGGLGFDSNASDLMELNYQWFDGVEFSFLPSRSESPDSVELVSDDLIIHCPQLELVCDDLVFDCPKKELACDDLISDCPSGGDNLMTYDEIFPDFSSAPSSESGSPCSTTVELCPMEEDLMDAILNECEGPRMGDCMDSHELCEDGKVVSISEGLSQDWSEGNNSISSEGVNTSLPVDLGWASLIPCSTSTDSEEYKGLRLVHLLTACADAIAEEAHDLVEIILARLGELASPTGSAMERVAYYLSQSLHQLHHHRGSATSNNITKDPNYWGALSLLNQAYPYISFAHFTANQSILEAITSQGKKVHIIDFDIMEGMQWPPLMEALKNENYNIAHLKITALRWDIEEEDNEGDEDWPNETRRRLSEYASSSGLPFSFQETQLEDLKRNIDCKEDEIVIVNCMWGLPHMLERSRNQLIEFIHVAKEFNLAALTMGTGPNSMASHNKLTFSQRFAQCLKNLCAVLDSVEAGLPAQYGLARAMVERFFMAPLMSRPISYLSKEEVGDVPFPCVIDSLLQSGFAESGISNKNNLYATSMAKEKTEYRVEMAGTNQLLLLWQSTPLTWVSTWTQLR